MLSDKGLKWVPAISESGDESFSSFNYFNKLLHQVFGHCPKEREIAEQLLELPQGNGHAAEYALECRSLVVGSSWNEPTLTAAF